jgi:hypothetical protein
LQKSVNGGKNTTVEMRAQTEADRGPFMGFFPTVFTFWSPDYGIGLINNVMMQKPVNFLCIT